MTDTNKRRRDTKNPRYGHKGGLPSVFPYKRTVSNVDLAICAEWLIGCIRDEQEGIAFAVTKHTQAVSHTLWLSTNAAKELQDAAYLSYVEETGDTDNDD